MKSEEEPFIREVSLEKENLTIVLASENQLAELAKHSTSELDFSIVQLDPTFNLGPYECTPISYRNLLLKSRRSGTSPVRLGPVLIHCRKDERTFREFLQTVVDAKLLLKVSRKKKRRSLVKQSEAFHKAMNFVLNLPSSPFLTLWIGRRRNGHFTLRSYEKPLWKRSMPLRIRKVSALYQIASYKDKRLKA